MVIALHAICSLCCHPARTGKPRPPPPRPIKIFYKLPKKLLAPGTKVHTHTWLDQQRGMISRSSLRGERHRSYAVKPTNTHIQAHPQAPEHTRTHLVRILITRESVHAPNAPRSSANERRAAPHIVCSCVRVCVCVCSKRTRVRANM